MGKVCMSGGGGVSEAMFDWCRAQAVAFSFFEVGVSDAR